MADQSTAPTTGPNGLVQATGYPWHGRKYKMANGMAWNTKVPYAVRLGTDSDYARFELRDTPNDHGPNDPAKKRRCEMGTEAGWKNGVTYWFAFSFRVHVDGLNKSLGQTLTQFQDPEGSSPSIAHRIQYDDKVPGKVILNTTTRVSGGSTISRGKVPLSLDTDHDLVIEFQMGANGFERTWLDGKMVSEYHGVIGSTRKDGYGFRFGCYGAPLSGMTVVQEYKNFAPYASTADQSARISAPPAW